jgi:hypothetical protein
VTLEHAMEGCERILHDEFAGVPEQALYMIGTGDDPGRSSRKQAIRSRVRITGVTMAARVKDHGLTESCRIDIIPASPMFGMRILFPHKAPRRAGSSLRGSALSLEGSFDSMRACSKHQEELAKSQASQARSQTVVQ